MATPEGPTRVVGVGVDTVTGAPQVVVKGAGATADWVLDEARGSGTPVVRDAALLEQLYRTPMNAPVGRELFPVMAVLLSHVLRTDQAVREKKP